MQSTISVYNLALSRLGGNQIGRVNLPQEDSIEAKLCNALFPHCADMALSAHPWGFATRRALLAAKTETGQAGYPLRFALPADCLNVLRLEDAGGAGSTAGPYKSGAFPPPHVIEGRDLLTAQSAPRLIYIARAHEVAAWPACFADAVAWSLAAELSVAMLNDARRQQFYIQKYEQTLLEAKTWDLNQQQPPRRESAWLE